MNRPNAHPVDAQGRRARFPRQTTPLTSLGVGELADRGRALARLRTRAADLVDEVAVLGEDAALREGQLLAQGPAGGAEAARAVRADPEADRHRHHASNGPARHVVLLATWQR